MRHLFAVSVLAFALSAGMAAAQGFERIGYGRLITNDFLGDGYDRWRSGSVSSSRIYGYSWGGDLPDAPLELWELRFLGEVIAPDDLVTPDGNDRRYAGVLSLGAHTHFEQGGIETSLGVDVVAVGPQTQLDEVQSGLHDILGVEPPSDQTKAEQIQSKVYPSIVVEMGHDLAYGAARLRPFVEGRAGVENLVRVGADLSVGHVGQGELLVRDPVTGQRYRTIENDDTGFSFVLGGDIAHVTRSAYLPAGGAAVLNDARKRVRAGLHWSGERSSAFYGVTWMSKEFETQTDDQILGSIRLRLNF